MSNETNTTSMIYEGVVDVSIKIDGKVYKLNGHNAGTTYLKYAFAKAMIFELNKWDTPGYIMLTMQTDDGERLEFLNQPIQISGRLLVDEVDGYPTSLSLTAYIPFDSLRYLVDITDTHDFFINLLSWENTTNNNICNNLAEFKIKPIVLSYITPGTTATLNWTIRIKNLDEV